MDRVKKWWKSSPLMMIGALVIIATVVTAAIISSNLIHFDVHVDEPPALQLTLSELGGLDGSSFPGGDCPDLGRDIIANTTYDFSFTLSTNILADDIYLYINITRNGSTINPDRVVLQYCDYGYSADSRTWQWKTIVLVSEDGHLSGVCPPSWGTNINTTDPTNLLNAFQITYLQSGDYSIDVYARQGLVQNAVEAGDRIKVDYIGKFADGRVFDTSLWEVASDDTAYPKSLFFGMRGDETAYRPLEFTVGQGTIIRGFDLGVRGMVVGETKIVEVTVDQGYGPMDHAKMVTLQLEEKLPLTTLMDKATFKATYGEEPVSFRSVTNQRLGLPAYVLNFNSQTGKAEVTLQVDIGETYKAYSYGSYGWDVEVTAIEDGQVTIRHLLDEDDELNVRGYDNTGLWVDDKAYRDCYVYNVDEAAGTFVLNYNREVVGHQLTFVITLIEIS